MSSFFQLPKKSKEWLSLLGITILLLFTLQTCIYYSGLLGQVSPETSASMTLVILFQLIVHNLTLFTVLRPRPLGLTFLITFMLIELTASAQMVGLELIKNEPVNLDRISIILIKLLAVYFCRHRFVNPRP